MARRGGVPVSAHDDAREAVAALARAVRRVHDAAEAVGEAHDADLESELDALARDAGEALDVFKRATKWQEAER